MADSLTIKWANGQADTTGVNPTNSATATGVGAKQFLTGPPLYGGLHTQGRFDCAIAGTSGTFTWLRDEAIDNSLASPTTFLYGGEATT